MQLWLKMLAIFYFSLIWPFPPPRQYMVLVPSLLHTGTPEKVCLLLSYLNETVTVSASLESPRENRNLFTDLMTEKDLFRCVTFTVSPSCLSLFDTLY